MKTFAEIFAEVLAMPSVIVAEQKAADSVRRTDEIGAEIKQRIHEALKCGQ